MHLESRYKRSYSAYLFVHSLDKFYNFKKVILLLITSLLFCGFNTFATVVFTEDFESVDQFTLVQGGQTNYWVNGTATKYAGTNSLYITNNGSANQYTNSSSSVSHAYADINFPSGETFITLTFWWKNVGESGYDFLKAFLVPTSTTPVAGTQLASGQIGIAYVSSGSYTMAFITLDPSVAGTTQRLVFSWRNDGSGGSNPPASIDNIEINSSSPPSSYSETFEGDNTFTLINGTPANKWWLGTATYYNGSKSLYISNNSSANAYTHATSVVHAYRDITFPADETDISLSFWYKLNGENNYDDLKVFLIATTTTPVAGTALGSGQIGSTYVLQPDWTQEQIVIDPSNAGTTKRLVFSWRNDGSGGTQPPAAIDDIEILTFAPAPPSDYRTKQSGSWNMASTWERFDGDDWVDATASPTYEDLSITIRNGHTVTVNTNISVDEITIDSGGTVETTGTSVLTLKDGTGTDMTVNGTYCRSSTGNHITFDGSATMYVGDGGTYKHNVNNTGIPATSQISWNSNSTLEITGITSTTAMTNIAGHSFGNFKWNCTNQTSTCALNTSITVNGDLSILTTGSGILTLSSSGGPHIITLNGDYIQSGGVFNLYSGGTSPAVLDITDGDFNQNAGTLNSSGSYSELRFTKASGIQNYTQAGSLGTYVRIVKNAAGTLLLNSDATWPTQVTVSSGVLDFGSSSANTLTLTATSLALNFNGSTIDMSGGNLAHKILYSNSAGASTFTPPTNFTHGTGDIFEVSAGSGTLTLGSDITFNHLNISGGTLYSGAVLRNITINGNLSGAGTLRMNGTGLAHTLTLNGENNSIGTFTTTSTSESVVTYARSGNQSVFASPNYVHIAFSNGGNKTLNGSVTIGKNLTLNSGLIILGEYDLIMNSNTSVINGNSPSSTNMIVPCGTGLFYKSFATGNTAAFTYPVGDNSGTAEYSPVIIDFSANAVSGRLGVGVVDETHPFETASSNISRYWMFNISGLTTYTYVSVFNYTDDDVNGTEADLKLCRYDNGNSVWVEDAGSTVNTTNNTITSSSLTNTTGPLTNNEYTGRNPVLLYYRTTTSGNWNNPSIWETSSDPNFVNPAPSTAVVAPNYINCEGIIIKSGHTVSLTTATSADQLTIEAGGILDLVTYNLNLYHNTSPDITINGTLKTTTGQLYAQVASVNIRINGSFITADADGFSSTTATSIRSTNTPVIELGDNAIVEYNGTNQNVTNSTAYGGYKNLVLSNSGTKTMTANITVNESLDIGDEIALSIGAFTLSMYGEFSGNGTISGGADSNISILGSGDIGTVFFTEGSRTIKNLTINRTGESLTLGTELSVSGILTLTAGYIISNENSMLTVTNSSTTSVTGYSANSFIKGPISRTLPASLVAGSTYFFPVGKTEYKPFEMVDPTVSSAGTIIVTAEVFESDPGGTEGEGIDYMATNRFWKAYYTGSGELTGTYVRLTESGLATSNCIAKSSEQEGVYEDIGSNNVGATITSDNITSFSFFRIAFRLNMIYSSSTTTQENTSCVANPSNNQEIIGIKIITTGGPANPINVSSFTFNTNGSTNASVDISNAKLWYTGTTDYFSATTQIGSTYSSPSGSFVINGFTQNLAYGTNYFWLTYDVPATATYGNYLDAECNSITVGSVKTPTVQAPTGNRLISAYATLPYYQGFDATWVNKSGTRDVPDGFWVNTYDATDADSWWRRNDDGASAGWTSPTSGSCGVFSGYSARFHSYYCTSPKQGKMDLYIDLSPTGTKKLYFRYMNNSSSGDQIVVKLSNDGGATFPVTLTTLVVSATWITRIIDISAYTSATSVIRFQATGDNTSFDIGIDEVNVKVLDEPVYASLPYFQDFDGSWLSRSPGNCKDIPDESWINEPEIGPTSWRRQNEGSLGDWTSPSSGISSPYGGSGGCADFHSYYSSGTGDLLLYVDLSPSGTKELTFEYKNTSGSDALSIKLSSDGGSTFPVTLSSLTTNSAWTTYVVDLSAYTSSTSVIRFRATGDGTSYDPALDNISIKTIPDPVKATIPYCQDFESSWINRSTYKDVPDNSWITIPSTGATSWRRQNEGSYADWTGSSSGLVSPSGSTGVADFHSYYSSGTGYLDLYIDFNTPGTKLLTFNYLNASGSDNLEILFNEGSGWVSKGTYNSQTTLPSGCCTINWLTQSIVLGNSTSSNCIIRFKATGDNTSYDIGLDNVCVSILPDPVYAELPFEEDFEDSWTNRLGYKDIPGVNWTTNPAWGGNSWRRQNEGCTADWSGSSSGLVTPNGSTGAADFHSYYSADVGDLDLYVNFNTVGTKLLVFNFLDASGTDNLKIYLSTNGPSGPFTLLQTFDNEPTVCSGNWVKRSVNLGDSESSTCIVRFRATGDNSSYDIGIDNINISVLPDQEYTSIPYFMGFENSWIDKFGSKDVPDKYWKTTPAWNANSWRRQNEGCHASWTSSSSGIVTPASGTGAANFHSYYSAGNGTMDLYVNLSTAGYKRMTFDYKNASGSDNLEVLFSTNGGASWVSMLSLGSGYNWAEQYVDFDSTISPTCVVRFKAVGDNSSYDLGIDNVNIQIVNDIYFMDTTTVTTCSGIFFDSGGNLSNYSNDENITKTFYPDDGNFIVVKFNSFSTQSGSDLLYAYNGPNVASPQFAGSPFSGNSLPPNLTSSHETGAITFRFVSNSSTVSTGWKATITCKPDCSENPPGAEYCNEATPICNLDSYCGNTADYDAAHSATDPTDEDDVAGIYAVWSPWTIENNSWISFMANESSITFNVWVENCQSGRGIQIGVFSSSDCESFVRYGSIWSPAAETDGTFEISGLTPGNEYLLMIDGYAGDICAYTLGVDGNGALVPNAGPDVFIPCGGSTTLQASGGTSYAWSPATGLSATNISDPIASPTTTTIYTVTVTGGNPDCPSSGTDQVTISTDCDPLPVELISFYGECKSDKIFLYWITYTEISNDRFILEWSSDMLNWKFLGQIRGAGNSNSPIAYSLTDDKSKEETIYYRLRQVDYDGKEKLLKSIAVNCIDNNITSLTVFPNPCKNLLHLQIVGNVVYADIVITDLYGNLVYETNTSNLQFENGTYLIDMEKWAEGVYFLKFSTGTFNEVVKIIKM